METREWLIFSCRACHSMVKAPTAMAGIHVVCPTCRTKVSVPADARLVTEEYEPDRTSLPVTHEEGRLREARESWERTGRPIGEKDSFLTRIGNTTSPDLQPETPYAAPVRVNTRRRKNEQLYGDDGDPGERKGERRKRTKLRNTGAAFAVMLNRMLFVFIAVLAVAVSYIAYKKWNEPPPDRGGTAPASAPETLDQKAFSSYRAELESAIAKLRSVNSVNQLLPLVRDPERVTPAILAYYDRENPWQPLPATTHLIQEPPPFADGNYLVAVVELEFFKTIPVSFEKTDKGFMLDWESYVGYGELTWPRFLNSKPEKPTLMRVVMKSGPTTNYFDGNYASSRDWHCYQLTDRGADHFLYGYAKPGSEVDLQIKKALFVPGQTNPVKECYAVVRLKYPPRAQNIRQVEILEFLEKGWLIREDSPVGKALRPLPKQEAQGAAPAPSDNPESKQGPAPGTPEQSPPGSAPGKTGDF